MNAVAVAVIGVAATLLGSFSTYVFQTRTAKRAEAFARDERLRQEQLTACSAYAGSLSELKQGLIRIWFHREDPAGSAWKEARAEGDRLGAAAEAAQFRFELVSGDSRLMELAESAFSALGAIHTASDKNELRDIEKKFEGAVKELIAAAGALLRAIG